MLIIHHIEQSSIIDIFGNHDKAHDNRQTQNPDLGARLFKPGGETSYSI